MPVQATKLLVPRCEVASLGEVVSLCQKDLVFKTPKRGAVFYEKPASYLIDQIVGQAQAKRALTISLVGGHNVIFSGPPGSGKTMFAQADAKQLPECSYVEYLDVLQLHTLARNELVTTRPFRSPHHTTSGLGYVAGEIRPD
jgi:magnesium chelatase family protein